MENTLELKNMVLLVGKIPFIISRGQQKRIMQAIEAGKKTYTLPVTFEVIPLVPAPMILTIERYESNDREMLARCGKFRCDYGNIHENASGCSCRDLREAIDPFKPLIHPNIKKTLLESKNGISVIKSMPGVSYADLVAEKKIMEQQICRKIEAPLRG